MVYLIAMVAFISVLVFNFSGTAKYYVDELQSVKKPRGRAFSLNQLQKMLSTTKSLSESARFTPANSKLYSCIEGGATGACIENCCTGNSEQEFYFKDPLDTSPQIEMKRNLSGPASDPVYYKEDGSLCTAPGGNLDSCAYSLTSSFKAHCPAGAAICDHAEHLEVTLRLSPLDSHGQIKGKTFLTYYFPKVNFPPSVTAIPDQALTVGISKTVAVIGDSGHPSENQNFKYAQCISSSDAIVKIVCQDFASGTGQINLKPLAVGTATITVQINDGGLTNFLSKTYSFNAVVSP